MAIKEHLQKIQDIKSDKYFTAMSDQDFEKYVKELNDFIDCYPAKEKELRAAVEKKDIDSVCNLVEILKQLLIIIHADDLAEECSKQLNNFKKLAYERVAAYVTYFITTMASLSLDIQLALFMDENKDIIDSQGTEGQQTGEKIVMAVDDDSFCLDTLKSALAGVSCKVIGVTNGTIALNVLRTKKPDLFLLDIEMPAMNGIELAGKIRELGYKQPIIFITGNADKSYVVQAVRAGGVDFILKPINPKNVVSRISRFL
jgi:CheY-like chemotaxis protein